ncbi:hypothetical protein CONLIGDRAFT_638930 [Coniochaeta ligniaria NRRL 30616]|uniref:DUF7907 domain-containing protein n=1 Tax=Coniochaeta ligniaria NRRL 30616 TaxID=1408157 RepID=A0A1J7JYT7_9PEZI|nr:hypothetical protein CONLIGDRAFT_638930 [Coniochaeta ligniaria NRRL 30616]
MASANPTPPPPPKPGQFFLKTEAPLGAATGRFSGLYLRQNSAASPAVVLTQSSPKFLRANMADDTTGAGVDFTSWAPQHTGRKWSLVLGNSNSTALWEPVEIAEDRSDMSLKFGSVAAEGVEEMGVGDELRGGERWTGWMVCEWSLGHPQLFWITDQLGDRSLPDFCERVRLVRAPIL